MCVCVRACVRARVLVRVCVCAREVESQLDCRRAYMQTVLDSASVSV